MNNRTIRGNAQAESPPSRPIAASPGRFLRWYFGATLSGLLAMGTFNAAIDPLQFYHRPFFRQSFINNQRYQSPGLIKHQAFDAVVIGTSHTENFLPADIEQALGWRALKLSLSGSLAREQREVLDLAIATGKVQRVLWCLDDFAFLKADRLEAGFPDYLYRPTWQTPLRYLLSRHTCEWSCRALRHRKDTELETLGVWPAHLEFSDRAVLSAWRTRGGDASPSVDWEFQGLQERLERDLFSAIEAHPEIEFRLYFPPHPLLCFLHDFREGPERFSARLAFRRQVIQRLVETTNCRLYDFQAMPANLEDFSQYMDLTHHSPDLNRKILGWLAREEGRIHSQNAAQFEDEFVAALTRFVLCDSECGRRYRDRLHWEALPTVQERLQNEHRRIAAAGARSQR